MVSTVAKQVPSPESDPGSIKIRDLCIEFRHPDGNVMEAVSDVNLTVRSGEFVCLVGPSGCGKSTTLRAIAGLQQVASGSIALNDTAVSGPARDRCMVFQEYALFPWYTANQNVAYGFRLQGMRKAEREAIASEWLARVGLAGFDRHFPSTLSGGMRQRVAIARALAVDPAVLLMDEPFGALDAQTRTELQGALLQIWKESRKTTVFVTHSIEEAVYLADRIVVMAAGPGRIVDEIEVSLDRPRSRLSKEFNDYKGRVELSLRSSSAAGGSQTQEPLAND